MRTHRLAPLTLAAAAGLLACGGGLTVRATGLQAAPKPPGCDLEVLRNAPDRPHDVLAELEAHVTRVPPEGALAVVKPRACALGADAIVVVRNMVLNEQGHALVAATAIRYRPVEATPPDARPESAPSPGEGSEEPRR